MCHDLLRHHKLKHSFAKENKISLSITRTKPLFDSVNSHVKSGDGPHRLLGSVHP